MKIKGIILLVGVLAFGSLSGQTVKDYPVKSEIRAAVVYLTAAELEHQVTLNLTSGITRLKFTDISEKINPQSIRVTTHEEIDILSISSKINYLTKKEELPRIKQLKDSLELLKAESQNQNDLKNAFVTEKEMLLQNQKFGGTNTGLSVEELKAASGFFRKQMMEINKEITKIDRKSKYIRQGIGKLESELNELNAASLYARTEIEILVSSPRSLKTDFELKYLVNDAGWSPLYDLKAIDTDKPVELTYRGRLFNNTGVDWTDISVKLSTADPTRSVDKPVLKPWFLKTYVPHAQTNYSEMLIQRKNRINTFESDDKYIYDEGASTTSTPDYTETAVPELSAEFIIERKVSVPADDKPYPVDISHYNLPASYKHYAVPKNDKDVFLLARIAGWQELNMVDGPMNVYYSGTYLGESFIDTRQVGDTIDMSLGRDSKVLVTRTKQKEFSSTRIIGNKRRENLSYEITVKNNRQSEIEIDILEQIPISQTDDIRVRVLEVSEVKPNEITGEIIWTAKLKPGESRKYTGSFMIEYPKDQKIEITQNRQQQVRYKF